MNQAAGKMESNFHSTVLQRPIAMGDYDDERDHERDRDRERDERRRRDILNPVHIGDSGPSVPSSIVAASAPPSTSAQTSSQSSRHSHSHSFSLRSPTQSDHHHPPPLLSGSTAASPSSSNIAMPTSSNGVATATASASRSGLHNPFMASASPSSLPQPVRSPLHAPSVYYPQDLRDARDHREPPREKTAGSFYDPTTDTTTTTSERRVSDTGSSWHNATQTQGTTSSTPASSSSKVSKGKVARQNSAIFPFHSPQYPLPSLYAQEWEVV